MSTVREREEAVITLVASLVKGIDMLAAIACNMLIMIAILSLFPPDHRCEPWHPALLDGTLLQHRTDLDKKEPPRFGEARWGFGNTP